MSVDLSDLLVKPVPNKDDTFAFQFDFIPEGKAVEDGPTQIVTELEDGDLLIEGWAADFTGLDRQNENFAPGAFQRGIQSFLSGTAPLCYHHKHDKVLGKVLDLREEEGKGLKLRARVDGATRNHPELGTIYGQIRNGSIAALSVGGFFKRKLTANGWKIVDVDMTEISTTAVPVHPRTSFAVVAGKALEGAPDPDAEEAPSPPPEVPEELLAALDSAKELVGALEAKALPNKHNPSVAVDIRNFLTQIQQMRQTATALRAFGEVAKEAVEGDSKPQEELGSLADDVETALVKWEADAHKLAAKHGPLPPPPTGGEL